MVNLVKEIGELYKNPVGHDALAKVLMQLNVPEKAIINGFFIVIMRKHNN